MMVNGPLEIYGTVIGVKLFDETFNILTSMGVIFIPLVILFFENSTKPYESEIENGASTSLRKVGIHFLLWVFTVMLFVAPTWPLDVTAITYKPVCSTTAVPSKFGDTGTTYDDAFENLQYQDIKVPIMLEFILTGMSGFTNASITSLPCKTDVQSIKNTIDTTRLTPALAGQVQRFQNECFAPARARFDSKSPDPSTYQSTMNEYGGQTDLSWIGSHVFQSLYYSSMYPSSPVPGFPYAEFPNQYQSYNSKSGVPEPEWGFPSCEQWWMDPEYGLQYQLVQLASQHNPSNPHLGEVPLLDQVEAWLAEVKTYTGLGSQVTPEDVISHDMLYDVGANSGFGRFYSGYMNIENSHESSFGQIADAGGSALSNVAAQAGQALTAVDSSIERAEVSQEIPILQAVLLAIFMALGPLVIMLGMMTGRSISVIFTYYFLLSSLLLMAFIERLIHYLETSLHASQSFSIYAMGDSLVMYNVFTKLYFFGPMIYLGAVSIAGIGLGSALETSFGGKASVRGTGDDAGKKLLGAVKRL